MSACESVCEAGLSVAMSVNMYGTFVFVILVDTECCTVELVDSISVVGFMFVGVVLITADIMLGELCTAC